MAHSQCVTMWIILHKVFLLFHHKPSLHMHVGYKDLGLLYGQPLGKGEEGWDPRLLHRSKEVGRRCCLLMDTVPLLIPCSWLSELVLSSSLARGWCSFMTTLDLSPQGMQHVHWLGAVLELQKRHVRLTCHQWDLGRLRSLRLSPGLMIWSIFELLVDLSFVTSGSERALKVMAWFTLQASIWTWTFPAHHVSPSAPQAQCQKSHS